MKLKESTLVGTLQVCFGTLGMCGAAYGVYGAVSGEAMGHSGHAVAALGSLTAMYAASMTSIRKNCQHYEVAEERKAAEKAVGRQKPENDIDRGP